ncbi:hypothetical protein [Streptomyces sp. NPDC002758]
MADTPMFQNTLTYSGQNFRDAFRAIVMGTGSVFGARAGVRPGDPGLNTTLAGSTISVSPGTALITSHGVYVGVLTSAWSGTLTAAHATLSRIDLVYLRIWDTDFDSSGLRKTDVVYLPGTPSSTPVAPSPGGTEVYLPLATITVPPAGGGSPSVSTSVLQRTVAPGGILPSSTAPSTPYVGQYYDDGTNLFRWNGSAWDAYQKMPGAATSWTPTWSTTSGVHLPSYGNAQVDCRYFKLGRLVLFNMSIIFGSTTNFGAGATSGDNWTFSLPFTATAASYPIGKASMEPGTSRGTSGVAQTTSDSTGLSIYVDSGTTGGSAAVAGIADSISPWVWASGNKLVVIGQYEATT